MYCVLLVVVLLHVTWADVDISKSEQNIELEQQKNYHVLVKRETNQTFVDKEENLLRVPALNYFEHKVKKKIKKSPKRTIQKIIKKNKSKLRKVYFNQPTRRTETTSPNTNLEIYHPDEVRKWKGETSTQNYHKHRNKNNKVVRYHMPFQKLQKKKENWRHKRSSSRELFILKDLDQFEFLSKENGNSVVKGHVTKYWKV